MKNVYTWRKLFQKRGSDNRKTLEELSRNRAEQAFDSIILLISI